MAIKETLEKISKNTYLVFILMIPKAWDIIKPLINGIKMIDITEYYRNYDWIGFFVQLIIVTFLYLALRQNKLMKEKLIADTESLNEKIRDFNTKFEEYRVTIGQIEQMRVQANSTSNRAFVAYLNTFNSPEEVQKIALTLLYAQLVIPDCENIGISPAIIAAMRKEHYAEKYNEQVDILDRIYPPKEESDETKKIE